MALEEKPIDAQTVVEQTSTMDKAAATNGLVYVAEAGVAGQ